MPNPEILHGDEGAIEHCSGVFFEVLDEHTTGNYGEISWQTAENDVERTRQKLQANGFSEVEIASGLLDATSTIKDRDIQLSYMDLEL